MDYAGTIDYILSLQKQGVKLGLDKMQQLTRLFGNPERTFRCIHIAGTNGKGSVAAMCAALLRESGYSVGLYTSPHLVSFTERIRIDDRLIDESDVIRLASSARDMLAAHPEAPTPTFFEFATLLAFLYFREEGIDWAVLETGMGGRLDATNVVLPEVSVITRIGLDHQEYLGETLAEIAREKAGIMKQKIPVVSAAQEPAAREVLAAEADRRGCPIAFCGDDFSATIQESALSGLRIFYTSGAEVIDDITVPLAGRHQAENAAVAIHAVQRASARLCPDETGSGPSLSADVIRRGLAKTRWRGRLEILDADPLTLVDGAHNPAAAEALDAFLAEHAADRAVALVLGILADKDMAGIVRPLIRHAAAVFVTEPKSSRTASVAALGAIVEQAGLTPEYVPDVHDAIEAAQRWCAQQRSGSRPLIVIAGSLYTAGEACTMFGAAPILGGLREQR